MSGSSVLVLVILGAVTDAAFLVFRFLFVSSNCVINLTINKIAAFKEIYRILKPNGSRTVISDLVTSKEVDPESANSDKWCSCIDGALTKEHYLDIIRKAGFSNVEVLEEKLYMDGGENIEGRRITSLVIKAVKP
jgi:arsenite methyltransferase